MKTKQELLEGFDREEDDSYFLEVLIDLRDSFDKIVTLMENGGVLMEVGHYVPDSGDMS